MITKESILTLDKIPITLFGEEFLVDDVFIDGKSFQNYLKTNFKIEFSEGRFKEPFMLRLQKGSNEVIVPLYGCTDSCCNYVFVKITKNDKQIIWENLGRNREYIFPKTNSDNKIEWVKDFSPISFSKNNYNSIIANRINYEN